MTKAKRFLWVRGPSSTRQHIKYGNTAEGLTKCGIPAGKGWWWLRAESVSKAKQCKRCSA